VYETNRPDLIIQYFKDDATAFNALKKGRFPVRGSSTTGCRRPCSRCSSARASDALLGTQSDREMLCRRLDIIKIEAVARNIVAGSLAKRTGLEEGTILKQPIVEFYYKSDPLGDPMLNDDNVRMLRLATPAELIRMRRMTLRINAILRPHLARRGLLLWISSSSSGGAAGSSIWAMRSLPTRAASGTAGARSGSTKTGSAVIWGASKKPIRKSNRRLVPAGA